MKFKILVIALLFMISFSNTPAKAFSLFYDLTGSSNIYWTSTGVSASVSSTCNAEVDFVQAYAHLYLNGTLIKTTINAANDAYNVSTYAYGYSTGRYTLSGQHDSIDWTGDYTKYTSAIYTR